MFVANIRTMFMEGLTVGLPRQAGRPTMMPMAAVHDQDHKALTRVSSITS